jgi:ATP-dependent helicase HrpB
LTDIRTAISATGLPLIPHLDSVVSSLASRRVAVLRAEPGSGRSTLVPLAIMAETDFFNGRIVMLEPRRIAAVGVASRMAELLGEESGGSIGYSVRLERRVSSKTRVEVVTEGLLARRLQADPGLDGVSVLIFDEFHERSIHADLARARARARRRLRSDLALLVMSATMDAERLVSFLTEAEGRAVELIDCPGRPFPVEIVHRPLPGRGRMGDEVGAAVVSALDRSENGSGDALVFLPGKREIDDAASVLGRSSQSGRFEILKLHGSLPLAEQRRIIAPPKGESQAGRRRVVFSTNVAETSLTVSGVTLVVDSGYVRTERYHLPSAMDRLSLERASMRSAEQRAGRAGRLAPGRCIRLWPDSDARPEDTEPEILRVELSSLVLDCALWGVRKREELSWLDPPPATAWEAAVELLRSLKALDADSAATSRGARMASLGLPPRLAALVLEGEARSIVVLACAAAAALADRDGSGLRDDADFRRRLALLRFDREEAREDGGGEGLRAWRNRTRLVAEDLLSRIGDRGALRWKAEDEADVGALLAAAFPDRVARRQENGAFRFPSGREARVDGPLAREEWIVAPEADAGERLGVVRLCAPLARADAEASLAPVTVTGLRIEWNGLAPRAVAEVRAGRLVLSTRREKADAADLAEALSAYLAERSLAILPWEEGGGAPQRLLERIRFYARVSGYEAEADWFDEALLHGAAEWLGPFLRADGGPVLDAAALENALRARLGWSLAAELDRSVPERYETPAGTHRKIDYSSDDPALDVRMQELFGLAETPTVLGVPLTLRLLSPAERPLQITRDLGGFWRGSYAEVRKEMRGRYPRHYWPEDPLVAEPTSRPKKRGT